MDSENILPKTYILKIQQIQPTLKERPEDTGQQPDHIHTCENPAPREGGKIQAMARQDQSAPPPNSQGEERSPSGAGREREPRTAKHPAPAIRTRSADTVHALGAGN